MMIVFCGDMDKLVYIKRNSKELREMLLGRGYVLDQNWEDRYLDMGTGICLTPENRFYVTVKETEPDIRDTYYCYDNEEMFEIFSRYYQFSNLSQSEMSKWCSYCGCEGGCNMCTSIEGMYNQLLVKYGY